MPGRIGARMAVALFAALAGAASVASAQSVRGYIFRSKGYVLWRNLPMANNVVEQNEKPHGEIWTQISRVGETYGANGRLTLPVHDDPPPPSITLDHQLRMALVIGDVVRGRPPLAREKASGANPSPVDPWHGAPLVAGLVPLAEVALYQGEDLEDGSRVDERWAAGQIWAYRLDPAEASWVAIGTPAITTTGDVVAVLQSFTSSMISVRIVADPTTTTHDDIFVHNVGMNVQPAVPAVHLQLGFQGTCGFYVNDELLDTTTTSELRFHLVDVFYVASAVPAMRYWGLGVLVLAVLATVSLSIRRLIA